MTTINQKQLKVYSDISNPTATDDVTKGFLAGHFWFDSNVKQLWFCTDNTASAAVWEQIDSGVTGIWDRTGTTITPDNSGDTLDMATGTIKFTTGATIGEFSTDGTLADNSDTVVSTEKAVKSYVDSHVGNGMWTLNGTEIEPSNVTYNLKMDTGSVLLENNGIFLNSSGDNKWRIYKDVGDDFNIALWNGVDWITKTTIYLEDTVTQDTVLSAGTNYISLGNTGLFGSLEAISVGDYVFTYPLSTQLKLHNNTTQTTFLLLNNCSLELNANIENVTNDDNLTTGNANSVVLRDNIKNYVDNSTSNGMWTRTGSTISPTNLGDDLSMDGGISVDSVTTTNGAGLNIGDSTPFSDSTGTLTLQNVDVLDATTIATIKASISTVNNQIGTSYTLTLSDFGKTVTLSNASPISLICPEAATENLPIGFNCVIVQLGAGQVTVNKEGTDNLREPNSWTKLNGQFASASITKIASNVYLLAGDFKA